MFQSPLSRGTTPDQAEQEKIMLKKRKFQSPLSRGTTPDQAVKALMALATMFQSPLSRGTPPDFSVTVTCRGAKLFQSPLCRGTPPDLHANFPGSASQVSIPSKSGHYSRRERSWSFALASSFNPL